MDQVYAKLLTGAASVLGLLAVWTVSTVSELKTQVAVLETKVDGLNPVLNDIYEKVSE